MNQFKERFNSYSNVELLEIIDSSSGYQPEAIEAAENELEKRQLSTDDLKKAKLEQEKKREERIVQSMNKKKIEHKIKNIGDSISDTLNPIQNSPIKTEKEIRILTIVFGIISVYQIYNEFGMLKFMFGNDGAVWTFEMWLYFLPLILVPISTFLFWFRKKIGWILIGIYLIYSAISTFVMAIQVWNIKPTGNPQFDSIFPTTSPYIFALTFMFFIGFIWAIGKRNIREEYSISNGTMITTFMSTSLLTLIYFGQYLF
eukprot:TRINITY_DN8077_c0_g3_i2.p1 TRINITY_DN8077_c0_g3~~TRINITY_DN8077_c0_g3_i2.p1  ORF type:complete len:258 (+),score=19.66 TRINITY_DN8077_c0_g3_i2:360-1133(+)